MMPPDDLGELNAPDEAEQPQADVPVDAAEEEEEPDVQEHNGLPVDIEAALIQCDDYYTKEEASTRQVMIAFWKKLENYFDGLQRIYFDYQANSGIGDWSRIDITQGDPSLYDKIINIFRAHGESLIAALSIKLPTTVFYPDDADISEDIDTAKAATKIAGLIQKHNEGILVFMKALYILYNQGVVAAYIYNREDAGYGTIDVPDYGEDVKITTLSYDCPMCQSQLHEEQLKGDEQPQGNPESMFCPQCQADVAPNVTPTEEFLPNLLGYKKEAKSRTIIDVFGPMYAHMPFYSRKQATMPYIALKFEQHITILQSTYPKFRDFIGTASNNTGADTEYERWARAYSQASDIYTNNLVTTTCRWLRPWAFECIDDAALRDKLKALYPKGCYFVRIGGKIAEAREESLDDHWQITHHPLSNYLHADPMGKPLAPVQDLRNEALDLAIETFEHSIPETFADAEVLDFVKYQQEEAKPGMVYPVKSKMGRSIGDAFHSVKTATLSDEIDVFMRRVDTDGQFVVGSFPSIYGGPNQTGSKTASEYAQSRAQALQRLNITWTMLKHWWANTTFAAVNLYIADMMEDEKIVSRSAQSSTGFVNEWIRQASLTGKIGRVEPDADEELPTSFSQVKQTLLDLITLNSDAINEGLFHPQNTKIIARAIGLPDVYIPGQDARDKEYAVIAELLKSGPLPDGQPTIPVEPFVDDNMVAIQTIKSFLNTSEGLMIKQSNPMGYQNVVARLMAHMQAQQLQTAAEGDTTSGELPTPQRLPQQSRTFNEYLEDFLQCAGSVILPRGRC
jgi:hypothetical protein